MRIIIIGGSRGGGRARRTPPPPPPTGPNSFVFAYIFTEKCPRRRSTPPLREILDPPLIIMQSYLGQQEGCRGPWPHGYSASAVRLHLKGCSALLPNKVNSKCMIPWPLTLTIYHTVFSDEY